MSTRAIRKLEIIKTTGIGEGYPDSLVFSDSIMDFSPEEMHTIRMLLDVFIQNNLMHRADLMKDYNQLPITFKSK